MWKNLRLVMVSEFAEFGGESFEGSLEFGCGIRDSHFQDANIW